ncbi:MAG: hypothetical protein O6846_04980, partial [Thaumarchaeota archaeon]|nr:hypothetical protein [Nitrososphaerota archaeon]
DNRPENTLVGTALGPMIEKTGINAKVKVYQSTEWSALTSDNEQTTLQIYPFTIGFRRESIDLFDFFFRAKFRRIRSAMEIPFLHGTWFPGKPGRPDFGLLGQIAREPSEAKRANLYQQAASYVVDNALLSIPLYTARTASYNKKVLNWNDVKFGPFWRGNGNYNPYRTKVA